MADLITGRQRSTPMPVAISWGAQVRSDNLLESKLIFYKPLTVSVKATPFRSTKPR